MARRSRDASEILAIAFCVIAIAALIYVLI
jgi:hypothetical protein